MRKLTFIFLGCILLSACKKEETFSEVPQISWLDYGPELIRATQDSIYFSISYTDRDGDLGTTDPQTKNLFVRDERIPLTYAFRISEIVPNGQAAAIKGTLNFSLKNTVLTGSSSQESVTYVIWVKDAAGNSSNEIRTQGLVVKAP